MSSTGQIIGTVVGAVIGFFAGGNVALGAAIGGAIGGAIDPPKGPDGPRLQDLSVQGVGYGSAIPRLYGKIATYGTVFWVENNSLKESENDSGGKGGGSSSTTYTYSATFALALCQGPIDGIGRIWIAGKLVYDAGATSVEAIMASNAFKQGFRLYTGSDTQLADSRMQATLGVANVPAYRGLAYIVFDDLPLADYGNSLMGAQIKVEVIAHGATYAYQNIVFNDNTGNSAGYSALKRPYIISVSDGLILCGTKAIAEAYQYRVDGAFYRTAHPTTPYIPDDPASLWLTCGTFGGGAYLVVTSPYFDSGSSSCYTQYESYVPKGIVHLTAYPYTSLDKHDLSKNLPAGTGVRVAGIMIDSIFDIIGVWFQSGATDLSCYLIDTEGNLLETHTFNNSGNLFGLGFGQGAGPGFNSMHFDYPSRKFAYAGGADGRIFSINILDGAASRTLGYLDSCTWDPFCYPSVYIKDGIAYAVAWDGVQDVVSVLGEVMTASDTTTLRSIVESECVSSNLLTLPDIDATALTQIVRGYKVANTGAIRSAIEPLQAAWPFDAVASGYKLKFIPRGGVSVATVSADELGASQPGEQTVVRITNSREMDIQLPRRVEVTYLDVEREYDQGEQFSERLNTDAVNVTRLEMPIVLNATEAAGKAEVLLYMFWMERNDLTFVLPPTFMQLEPADVITVNAPWATHIARLTNINYLPDGRLECSAKPASSSIYTPTAVGESGLSTGQVLTFSGNSVAELLDIPTINDSYGTPGFMVGMYGTWPSWSAGVLVESSDGGQVWVSLQSFTQAAAAGYSTNSMSSGVTNAWDRKNTLSVTMISGSLNSATEEAVLNRGNYFAYGAPGRWEIIGVQSVTAIDATHYTLSNFLRGRGGSEWAMSLHQNGDVLVRLDDGALRFIASTTSAINVDKLYKAVTNGQVIDAAETESFAYSGTNLEPLSPVLPRGSKHPSTEDWTLRCTRRTRIDGELRDYVDVPLGETSEDYRWIIYDSSYTTVKRTVDTTTPALTYTAAQQIADFSATQNDIYFDVAQLSATVGSGQVLRSAISTPSIFIAPIVESLMLYFNGSDGSTTFTDSASPPNTVTGSGSNVQISTTYSLSGGSSLWVNGGYITIAHAAWMDGGTDPFTLEWFHYEPTLYNSGGVVARRNSGIYCPWELYRSASGTFSMLASSNSTPWAIGGSQFGGVSIAAATWTHIALVYTGSAFQLYVGGTKSVTNMALSDVQISTDAMYIGTGGDASCRAYFEDVRYTPGIALYSANFTPPTSPL